MRESRQNFRLQKITSFISELCPIKSRKYLGLNRPKRSLCLRANQRRPWRGGGRKGERSNFRHFGQSRLLVNRDKCLPCISAWKEWHAWNLDAPSRVNYLPTLYYHSWFNFAASFKSKYCFLLWAGVTMTFNSWQEKKGKTANPGRLGNFGLLRSHFKVWEWSGFSPRSKMTFGPPVA